MYIFVTILIFIVCILLILIVLVQNSKGGGLAANFTGNTKLWAFANSRFLEKATWTLAGIFFVLCVLSVASIPKTETEYKSAIEDKVQNIQTTNPTTQPTLPVPTENKENPNQLIEYNQAYSCPKGSFFCQKIKK